MNKTQHPYSPTRYVVHRVVEPELFPAVPGWGQRHLPSLRVARDHRVPGPEVSRERERGWDAVPAARQHRPPPRLHVAELGLGNLSGETIQAQRE